MKNKVGRRSWTRRNGTNQSPGSIRAGAQIAACKEMGEAGLVQLPVGPQRDGMDSHQCGPQPRGWSWAWVSKACSWHGVRDSKEQLEPTRPPARHGIEVFQIIMAVVHSHLANQSHISFSFWL